MKEKEKPGIRMVTLKKNAGKGKASGCTCDDDDNCPECRVQPITCDCDPQGTGKKKNTSFKIGKKRV